MYNMTIKNLITNFFSFFTIFFTILLLSSCSLYSYLGMDQKKNKSFVNEDKYKKIKCPKTVVPRKSSIFLSSGNTYKSIVKLRKLKLICKIKSDENSLNKILFINYKAEISIKSISLKNKDILNLPKIYLAIINEKNNSVSAKILANTNIKANMTKNASPGASLRMWSDYFINADIYGGDIDKSILFEEERIKTFFVDQLNTSSIKSMWKNINVENFDIIIDDGLHNPRANLNFFFNSFNKIKKNGIYIIEDVSNDNINFFQKELKNYETEIVTLSNKHKKVYNNNNLVIVRKN